MSDRPIVPRLLKPLEAATILGIGVKALRAHDAELKPCYLNSRVKRYAPDALTEFIKKRRGV